MKLTCLLLLVFLTSECHSQINDFYNVQPNWINNPTSIIKERGIKKDAVYFYKKKKIYSDSSLIFSRYYDSLGNIVERNYFNFDGEVIRISNYTFIDTILLKEETVWKNSFRSEYGYVSKEVTTYEHDTPGHNVKVTKYSFLGDSTKPSFVTMFNIEYDSDGNATRDYMTPPKGNAFVHHSYDNKNGKLVETKTFNQSGKLMYSIFYEVGETPNVQNVYYYKNRKILLRQSVFNDQNLLIAQKDYPKNTPTSERISQAYFYQPDGLIDNQTYKQQLGKNYWFKHFYTN